MAVFDLKIIKEKIIHRKRKRSTIRN